MSTTSNLLRPLGMVEKLYTARQVLGIYHSVVVTATYTVPSELDDKSTHSLLRTTIPRLLQSYPSLCCYFEGQSTARPVFRRLETIEVQDVVQILHLEEGQSLEQKLEKLHDQQWSVEEKPLWKLVVISETPIANEANIGSTLHIAFVYHHAIGDGLSGTAVHRSLLHELNKFELTRQNLPAPSQLIATPGSTTLSEPIEKLISFPLSWLFLFKQALQEYLPQWLTGPRIPIWTGQPVKTLLQCPYRSRIRIVTIPPDQLATLLTETEKHGVRLTSLLTATLVTALAHALPSVPGLRGVTPYTLRRTTRTSLDEMTNQTSAFETTYAADMLNRIRNATDRVEDLWATATYFHEQMKAELTRCPRDNLLGLLPYVLDHVQFYAKKIGQPREASFELSNLGIFQTPQHTAGDWQLESMTFTQGAAPVGPAFAVNCVSTLGGPLMVSITWQEGVVDEEDVVEAVARGFEELPVRVTGQKYTGYGW